jgi:hypothetical protein
MFSFKFLTCPLLLTTPSRCFPPPPAQQRLLCDLSPQLKCTPRYSANERFSDTFATVFRICVSYHPYFISLLISLKTHSRSSPEAQIQHRIYSCSNPTSVMGERLQFTFRTVSPQLSDESYVFSTPAEH